MKNLLALLFVFSMAFVNAQDISSVFSGIEITNDTTGHYKYFDDYEKTRVYLNSERTTDLESMFNYSLMPSDFTKNPLFCVVATNEYKVFKAVVPKSNIGCIVIDKSLIDAGNYKLVLLLNGEERTFANLIIKKDTMQKKELGEYIVYWKENKFKIKYTGIE